MRDAVFARGARWPIEDQRLDPTAKPASDPHLDKVADMVGVQMGGEIRRDVLMRDFERSEIRLRARPKVHDEFVAVAELDQPGAVGLGAPHERPSGAERDDAHFVSRKRLGVGKVVVAAAAHGAENRRWIYACIMLSSDTSILVWQWKTTCS
jgi:hypothetical protein